MRRMILLAVFAFAGACGDDKADDTPPVQTGIPLGTWVHALVTERTSDEAEPDTVEDKTIVDVDDPAAFDAYLM
jgi:hypothetical protein